MRAPAAGPMRLCGIGDEAAFDAAAQVRIHGELGLAGIELRTMGGRWLHELDAAEVGRVAALIGTSGLCVPVVDTPLGGWSSSLAVPLDDDLRMLASYAERAAALGCHRLRVMSYPDGGRGEGDWEAEVVRRLRALTREADRLGLVLLHENCVGWGSQTAGHTLRLLDQVSSERLRLLFDTGNGVWYGYRGPEFLDQVLPYVDHVHLKDGVRSSDGGAAATWPGAGGAGLRESLALLHGAGYAGWYSAEPHLVRIPHLAINGDAAALARSYRSYVERVRALWPGMGSGHG